MKLQKGLMAPLQAAKPPPNLTLTEWADRHRRLSSESSAEPGKWRTDRAPYQRGIQDAISDPAIPFVYIKKAAQVGFTDILLNAIGYYIDQDPSPIMLVQPTLEMGEAWSKDRLAPMLRDTPQLHGKVSDSRKRGSESTILHKKFPGGHLTIAGANSPASLASRPIRIFLADEPDRWPLALQREGDPFYLGRKRTNNFWNRKIVAGSSPTESGLSRIDDLYESGDKRHFHVPCPSCGHMQVLLWGNAHWDGPTDPVCMACTGCGVLIEERHKMAMLLGGEWIAEEPFHGIASFHISELYSPWRTWSEMRDDFLDAKSSQEKLRTFVNLSLGECWTVDDGEGLDWKALAARREDYTDPPEQALAIVVVVDVQDDRLEVEAKAFGAGQESWGLEYRVIDGDPGKGEVWRDLEAYFDRKWVRADGVTMTAACMGIDSGGHFTQEVYRFTKKWLAKGRRVYALKGMAGAAKPVVQRQASKSRKGKVPVNIVGTDTVKELLYFSRLREEPGAEGSLHFPMSYEESYFRQLVAERAIIKHRHGRPYRVWVARGRNEAADLNVYAIATVELLDPDWDALAKNLAPKPVEPKPKVKDLGLRVPASRSRGGFVQRWRK